MPRATEKIRMTNGRRIKMVDPHVLDHWKAMGFVETKEQPPRKEKNSKPVHMVPPSGDLKKIKVVKVDTVDYFISLGYTPLDKFKTTHEEEAKPNAQPLTKAEAREARRGQLQTAEVGEVPPPPEEEGEVDPLLNLKEFRTEHTEKIADLLAAGYPRDEFKRILMVWDAESLKDIPANDRGEFLVELMNNPNIKKSEE